MSPATTAPRAPPDQVVSVAESGPAGPLPASLIATPQARHSSPGATACIPPGYGVTTAPTPEATSSRACTAWSAGMTSGTTRAGRRATPSRRADPAACRTTGTPTSDAYVASEPKISGGSPAARLPHKTTAVASLASRR